MWLGGGGAAGHRRVRYELADPRLAHALGDLLSVVLTVDRAAACSTGDGAGCC
jgi:hypothetical protein